MPDASAVRSALYLIEESVRMYVIEKVSFEIRHDSKSDFGNDSFPVVFALHEHFDNNVGETVG